MRITGLDHVNIRTANTQAMAAWYADVLGLEPGPRPPFRNPGVWLYLGDRPIVHLVTVSAAPQAGGDVALEHFALGATGLAAFRTTLEERGIAHSLDPVPGMPVVQVNLRDPDGNHIHVDFDAAEMAG